jgi:predicted ATP-grasp superfamily ATP-dependent carboligase
MFLVQNFGNKITKPNVSREKLQKAAKKLQKSCKKAAKKLQKSCKKLQKRLTCVGKTPA